MPRSSAAVRCGAICYRRGGNGDSLPTGVRYYKSVSEQLFEVDSRIKVLLCDLGVRPGDVLRLAGLPGDLFVRPSASLRPIDYFALWNAVDDLVGDSTLPVLIAQALSPETFNPPIFAALCSPDFNQAARRIQAYKPLIGPLRINVVPADDATTINCVWPLGVEPPASLALTELLFWVSLIRLGTRAEVRPLSVTTREPPSVQAAFAEFLGVEVTAGERFEVVFRAGDAALPFLTASDDMWGFFAPELRRRLAQVEASDGTTDRVRASLLELLPAGRASMREVGRELAVSTRTLQRRLADENTTFQAVLAETRESLARHYLANSSLSTAEVSYLLGYSETSSFFRAFHDWTGETPHHVRATSN